MSEAKKQGTASFAENFEEQVRTSKPGYVKQLVCEKFTGLEAAAMACAALYARSTGAASGQLLELSMERVMLQVGLVDSHWDYVWAKPKDPSKIARLQS